MNNNNTDWPDVPCSMLVLVLRDLCIKYRPDFRFENNSVSQETADQASMNLFECFCIVGKDTTRGLNQKKMNAKNIAAEQMLRLYERRGLLSKLRIRLPEQPYIDPAEELGDNPISKLFELCQFKGLDRPTFSDDTFGKLFEVFCSLPQLGIETKTRNVSKKVAKKLVAKEMVERLESIDIDAKLSLNLNTQNGSECGSIDADIGQVKLIEKNPHSHIGVRNLRGVQIVVMPVIMGELHATSNFINVLDILAEQFDFTYDMMQLSTLSHFGLHQVFCRLQTFPIVTVPAMGATLAQAKQAAAHQAIEALTVASRRMAYREKTADFFKPKPSNEV